MKKLLLLLIALLYAAGIVASYYLFVKGIYVLFAIMLILYMISLLCVIGLFKYRAYMKSKIIDPKRHLHRNYQMIYLGVQNRDKTDSNVLDLRGYKRNFYVDVLLVQRYFSFLDMNGTIKIFTENDKFYTNSHHISVLDYPLLHPVTLLEHNIKPCKYILYNPLVGMAFLWAKVFRHKNSNSIELSDDKEFLLDFCKDRNIKIDIV